MTKLGWIIALLFALVLAFVWALPTTLLRYRITLEADIGGKPVSSSGVWHVEVQTMLPVPVPGPPVELHGSGEAIALDLGGGRLVFALLDFPRPANTDARPVSVEALPFLAFGVDTVPDPQARAAQVARLREQVELKGPLLPALVTFSELNDPTMARVVQPDAFVAVFGPGARFKRAFFEMVPAGVWPLSLFGIGGEPVTRGIESKVPGIVNSKSWNEKLNLLPIDRCRLMVGTRALKRE